LKNRTPRPGSVKRSAATPWAYPPGIAESGVGLFETLTGLVVFVILVMSGTNAFRGAAANQNGAPPQVGDYQGGRE
jgi:hypothetical protein